MAGDKVASLPYRLPAGRHPRPLVATLRRMQSDFR
jgi:hypothetical protein